MKIAFAMIGGAVVVALSLTALTSQGANFDKWVQPQEAARNLSIPEVLAKVRLSIARVIVSTRGKITIGTAFVFDESGHLLTNCHVVSDKDGTVINMVQVEFRDSMMTDRAEYPSTANVVGCDKLSDLAVLKVAKYRPAISAATDVAVGDAVVAIGYAMNIPGEPSVTRGIVSGLNRSLNGIFSGLIQTDASINHGNSGGPLLNMKGQFVGVATYTNGTTIDAGTDLSNIKNESVSLNTPYGIFYARHAATALLFARELAAHGRVPRADIGLSDFVSVSDDEARELLKLTDGGVFIKAFKPGSPLQAAGLREGDVITAIGECPTLDDCGVGKVQDVGWLTNYLAYIGIEKIKKLRIMALRPPACALDALRNNTTPSRNCSDSINPNMDWLRQVFIEIR